VVELSWFAKAEDEAPSLLTAAAMVSFRQRACGSVLGCMKNQQSGPAALELPWHADSDDDDDAPSAAVIVVRCWCLFFWILVLQ
jgi:hypothetical protein